MLKPSIKVSGGTVFRIKVMGVFTGIRKLRNTRSEDLLIEFYGTKGLVRIPNISYIKCIFGNMMLIVLKY